MSVIEGPLIYIDPEDKRGIATLIGIISWGAACGYTEWPSVYSRVSHVMDWIKEKTGKYQLVKVGTKVLILT